MTVDHPIAEENLRYFFPELDINNPPEGYARFIRKPCPELSPIQKLQSNEYIVDTDLSSELKTTVWTDNYIIRELNEEELIELASSDVRASNERMKIEQKAPYPAPDDGNLYVWSESSNTWVIMPENFNEVITKFTKKLNELGLSNVPFEELKNIDEDKKQQLQEIVNEINMDESFKPF